MLIHSIYIGHMEAGKTQSGFEQFKKSNNAVWIKLTLNKQESLKKTTIYSHNPKIEPIEGYLCYDLKSLTDLIKQYEVFFIDECQFITEKTYPLFLKLFADKTLYCFGLDMDYTGKPFSIIGELCCMATYVYKLHGVCPHGKLLEYTLKKTTDNKRLSEDVGQYTPVCRECFKNNTPCQFIK